MKKLVLIAIFLAPILNVYSQMDSDKALYIQKAQKYKKMKDTGTVLTVGGGILTIIGYITTFNSSITTTDDGYGNVTTTTEGHPVGGFLALMAGHAGLGAGIPLWIIGKNKERKYNQKLEGVSFKLNLNRQVAGVTLSCKL
jgi:hypothetical protein